MSNLKKIIYLTYQVFPNEKANNLQTIRMMEHLNSLSGYEAELIFPDRDTFDKEYSTIKNFYDINKDFNITTYSHFLPFNYFKKFKKTTFIISSFLWSFFAVKKTVKRSSPSALFISRTIWVVYFLSKYKNKIIYECHKFSKIEKLIFKRLKDKENLVIVFTNEQLRSKYKISNNLHKKSIVLQSSYEDRYFQSGIKKVEKQVIFVGHLLRFDKSRNLNFLINAFSDLRLKEHNLIIVGGPDDVAKKMQSENSNKNINFTGHVSNKQAAGYIMKSEIGILLNERDSHSEFYTSPIKYFEYLRGGLKIVAVDFESHRILPVKDNIFYFSHNDKEDLILKIIEASKKSYNNKTEVIKYSYESRVRALMSHVARLEGLEPPTL